MNSETDPLTLATLAAPMLSSTRPISDEEIAEALRKAKVLISIAEHGIWDTVQAHEVFAPGHALSIPDVADRFSELGWKGLDTRHFVKTRVEKIAAALSREIQEAKRAKDLASDISLENVQIQAEESFSIFLERLGISRLLGTDEKTRVSRDLSQSLTKHLAGLSETTANDGPRDRIDGRFFAQALGITHEAFLASKGGDCAGDNDTLRNLIWGLSSATEILEDPDKTTSVEIWLRGYLGKEEGIFSEYLNRLAEREGKPDPSCPSLHAAFRNLAGKWSQSEMRKRILRLSPEPVIIAVEAFLAKLPAEEFHDFEDADQRIEYLFLKSGAQAVLAWLNGGSAPPRTLLPFKAREQTEGGLEKLLLSRMMEFSMCIQEFQHGLEVCPEQFTEPDLVNQLDRLEKSIREQMRNVAFTAACRESGRRKGLELLGAIVDPKGIVKFDPYLVFKYAADRNLGEASDLNLKMQRSKLAPGAVITRPQ